MIPLRQVCVGIGIKGNQLIGSSGEILFERQKHSTKELIFSVLANKLYPTLIGKAVRNLVSGLKPKAAPDLRRYGGLVPGRKGGLKSLHGLQM